MKLFFVVAFIPVLLLAVSGFIFGTSPRALVDHALKPLYGQIDTQDSHQVSVEPSSLSGVSLLKCAMVEDGDVLGVFLQLSVAPDVRELSQVCVVDSVSGVKLLQSTGVLQEGGFQKFCVDTLAGEHTYIFRLSCSGVSSAGSESVFYYRIKVNPDGQQTLNLPALLSYSSSQRELQSGSVETILSLMLITPEQVEMALLLRIFWVCFLLTLLLSALGFTALVLLQRRFKRNGVNEGVELSQGLSDITVSPDDEVGASKSAITASGNEEVEPNLDNSLNDINKGLWSVGGDCKEGVWPQGVGYESTSSCNETVGGADVHLVSVRDYNEGARSLGGATECSVKGDEGVWPLNSLISLACDNEGVWHEHRACESVSGDNTELCPEGGAQTSTITDRNGNEGAWPADRDEEFQARLFVFRCAPPSERKKKKRSFLNFKKASVAPQPLV
ncbi:hypothetical protein DNTS_010117 [Danionella cerebrum]|uniref:Uncharacterized protein n=1 Tax=Danionella cerebrum TaxID=2873325 RepID=A0A553MM60_9TELE|nr:hypothetical protein DNTS_010117 [Danionella translucida]TRY54255.1 hypothetical protein DNTS_010117 [Danionella translucida]TRY54256.1 hypothetical protein DNTS_010117 [Danionella translucida]